MTNNYTVAAIITTFERNANIVENAILSIESQTVGVNEIILVDNNRNNEYTVSLKKMLINHPNVKYVKCDRTGACCARNEGIDNASSNYIGFLDDDDLWLPEKIDKQINIFKRENDDNLGMVYCSGIQKNLVTGEVKDYYTYRRKLVKYETTFNDLLENDIIGSTSQPLIKASCFKEVGGFMEEQPARQDYEMWLRISKKYRVIGINEKLFIYNKHEKEQITKSKYKANKGMRNIFIKYKKDIINNDVAYYKIVSYIYRTLDKKNIFLLFYYGMLKIIAKIKNKIGTK